MSLLGGGACILVTAASVIAQASPSVGATADIRDASNRPVATAQLREGRGEVLITLIFANPSPLSGTHAVHIDEVGRCDPPDFATSANIFNPFNKEHGRQNPNGAEVGDLPNVEFGNGVNVYNTTAIGATLGQGPGSLLNPRRAIVILSGQDDQTTGPEGNAGSRIACGVIGPTSTVSASGTALPTAAAVARVASPAPAGQTVQQSAQAAQPPQVAQPAQQQPQRAQQQGQSAQSQQVPSAVRVVSSPAAATQASPVVPVSISSGVTPVFVQPTPGTVAAAGSTVSQSNGGMPGSAAAVIGLLGLMLIGAGVALRSSHGAQPHQTREG
jgi:Cu-Zn family superoxide dismutase